MRTTDTESEYIKKNLLKSDLTPTQQMLFDFLGKDMYVDYCSKFGGLGSITVTKLDTLQKIIAIRKVKENIDLYKSGTVSVKQIARMHGLSESTVLKILSGR